MIPEKGRHLWFGKASKYLWRQINHLKSRSVQLVLELDSKGKNKRIERGARNREMEGQRKGWMWGEGRVYKIIEDKSEGQKKSRAVVKIEHSRGKGWDEPCKLNILKKPNLRTEEGKRDISLRKGSKDASRGWSHQFWSEAATLWPWTIPWELYDLYAKQGNGWFSTWCLIKKQVWDVK